MPAERQLLSLKKHSTAVKSQKHPAHFMRGLRPPGAIEASPSGVTKNVPLSGDIFASFGRDHFAASRLGAFGAFFLCAPEKSP